MGGVQLGHYELLCRLAAGGAANVFLAQNPSVDPAQSLVALKILLPSLAANQEFLAMFFSEARIASQLQHRNIVGIYGFGQVDGIYSLAMEYVFGASLAQVLRQSALVRRPLTVGVLLRIAAEVSGALDYAHRMTDPAGRFMGLVHRDVTPQNLLLGFNGVPKLTDFGIAKATGRGWETQAGVVKGKFSYMSPEQALGRHVDRRSDIFGLGIVLWEALTGKELFRGSTPVEVLSAIREQPILPPSQVVPGLTPVVDPIVMKALHRNPKQRFQTAAEMKLAIEELISRAGVVINEDSIAEELAQIYGDIIGKRAVLLRQAVHGRVHAKELADALGGSLLSPRHLPQTTAGMSHPDPLGLFTAPSGEYLAPPPVMTPLPARTDEPFVTQAEVPHYNYEDEPEAASRDLPEFFESQSWVPVSEDLSLDEWNESTAIAPSHGNLNFLVEPDPSVDPSLLENPFAERFRERVAEEWDNGGFGEEATLGMTAEEVRRLNSHAPPIAPTPDLVPKDLKPRKVHSPDTNPLLVAQSTGTRRPMPTSQSGATPAKSASPASPASPAPDPAGTTDATTRALAERPKSVALAERPKSRALAERSKIPPFDAVRASLLPPSASAQADTQSDSFHPPVYIRPATPSKSATPKVFPEIDPEATAETRQSAPMAPPGFPGSPGSVGSPSAPRVFEPHHAMLPMAEDPEPSFPWLRWLLFAALAAGLVIFGMLLGALLSPLIH